MNKLRGNFKPASWFRNEPGSGGLATIFRVATGGLLVLSAACSAVQSTPGDKTLSAVSGPARGMEVPSQDKEFRLYQIYINSSGRLMDPVTNKAIDAGDERTANDPAILQTEKSYLKDILDNYKRWEQDRKREGKGTSLTVFVHGGLNTFEHSTGRVKSTKDLMLNEGTYPLFISWDAGVPGNLRDHVFYVRRGIRDDVKGVASSPFVLLEDVARSVIRIPAAWFNILFSHRLTGREEEAVDKAIEKMSTPGSQGPQIVLHKPTEEEESEATRIATWSDPLWWNPTKLVAAPFIDGFGSGTWDSLVRRTDLVLRKRRDDDHLTARTPGTAASQFFALWEKEYGKKEPLEKREPVTLVGHSMGAIISNNIIAKYQGINFSRIVYMGAACRVKDLEYVVAPYLIRNPQSHFYNLSLHPKREFSEVKYKDFVPRGTLLVWIDQTFGEVNSFLDRTAGYWNNVARSAPSIFDDEDIRGRVHLTMFGLEEPNPLSHGDFDQFRFWRENFWVRKDCTMLRDTANVSCTPPTTSASVVDASNWPAAARRVLSADLP